MRRPSGDQEGLPSEASCWVRRPGLCPSASITYTSQLPSRSDRKAIRPPSGDQEGHPSEASWWVSLVRAPATSACTGTSWVSPPPVVITTKGRSEKRARSRSTCTCTSTTAPAVSRASLGFREIQSTLASTPTSSWPPPTFFSDRERRDFSLPKSSVGGKIDSRGGSSGATGCSSSKRLHCPLLRANTNTPPKVASLLLSRFITAFSPEMRDYAVESAGTPSHTPPHVRHGRTGR